MVICSISFEAAGKKVGSLTVNISRLIFGITFLIITTSITRGLPLPTDATLKGYTFLGISGFIGMFLGDLFMFEAFVLLGARVTTLIMTLVPVVTTISAWIILHETLSLNEIFAILLTVGGIFLVMLYKGKAQKGKSKLQVKGFLYAFVGVLGQALGMVFSKIGLENYDPIAGTQIRIIVGLIAIIILITVKKKWKEVKVGIKDASAMKWTLLGAFWGPFISVAAVLIALKNTSAGVVSTLSSVSPILVIPFSMIVFKEKICIMEIIGALLSVVGVSLFFL